MDARDEDRSPLPADCAERYRAQRLLGRGGFGEVWAATQVGLDRSVAIKVLSVTALENAEERERFSNEARISAAFSHPNIVRVLDHGAAEGRPWIAFELVSGPCLRDKISKTGMAIGDAIAAARDVLAALDHAHRAGVIHRDVKPDNVLQSPGGAYKVTDFGIAKWARDGAAHTRTGVVLGTPAYLAPEQLTEAKASAASDLYAWGTLVYELLVGEVPFASPDPLGVLQRHLREQPVPPSVRRAGIPPALERLVLRCLEKDPQARPGSAAEALAVLEQLPGAPPSTPAADPPRERAARSGAHDALVMTRRDSAPAHRSASHATLVSVAPGPDAPARPPVVLVLSALTLLGLMLLFVVDRASRTGTVTSPTSTTSPIAAAPLPPRLAELAREVEEIIAADRRRWPVLHLEDRIEANLEATQEARRRLDAVERSRALIDPAPKAAAPAARGLATRIAAYRFILFSEDQRLRKVRDGAIDFAMADWNMYGQEGLVLLQAHLELACLELASACEPGDAFFNALEDVEIVSRCFLVASPGSRWLASYMNAVADLMVCLEDNRVARRFLSASFGRTLRRPGWTKAEGDEAREELVRTWPRAKVMLDGIDASVTRGTAR